MLCNNGVCNTDTDDAGVCLGRGSCITHALKGVRCRVCLRRPAGGEGLPEELPPLLNSIMVHTNVAFFGVAGASLKLVRPARVECVCVVGGG